MRAIDPEGFEKKFRKNIDPWNYTHSRFERYKRGVLLRACGPAKHGRVLELGCAIGETTRLLARLSFRLVAVDASPTALEEATHRCAYAKNIIFRRALLPQEMPRGPFDLIVVSEVVYYLHPHDLNQLANRIFAALAPRGITIAVDHRRQFDDAAVLPALAHRRLRRRFARAMRPVGIASYPDFDIAAFQRRRGPMR
jgi:SAM-dependent methyltransferase